MESGEATRFAVGSVERNDPRAFIQPHGLLLVVDQETDLIARAAGNAAGLLGFAKAIPGLSTRTLLGASLAALIERAGITLTQYPTYLGELKPRDDGEALTITAHEVGGAAIIEAIPSIRSASAAGALASIRLITERLEGAADLIESCERAAREVQRATAYERVMIVRFLVDGSAAVVADAREDHLPPLLHHRFRASDIARYTDDLHPRAAIRTIPDVGYRPAPLSATVTPGSIAVPDLGYCDLRGAAPAHVAGLKAMGVGASMSVSLAPKDELWGLIICHDAVPQILPYVAQEVCRHIGQILSRQIRARLEAEDRRVAGELKVARDAIMRVLMDSDDPRALFPTLCADLGRIVPSHGVAICGRAARATVGHAPTKAQVRQLATWLEPRMAGADFFATDRLAEVYPEAGAFAFEAGGLLAIGLPGGEPTTLMWFRAEVVEDVVWAGDPRRSIQPVSNPVASSPGEDRASSRETVTGPCRAWDAIDIESAREFGPRAAFVLQQQRVRELNYRLGEANERLASLALTDALTGIPNRRAFDEGLQREWARANRSGRSLAMIILDLDLFKQYNDHHGHLMGDDCLRRVAQVLRNGRRGSDFAARIGGEEFSILLPGATVEAAMVVAEMVRARIEGQRLPHPGSPMGVVTASFGVAATYVDRTRPYQTLMQAADGALYQAKKRGRNRVAVD